LPEEAEVPEAKPAVLESVVSMIVHDLRNPAATMGANLSFVREVIDDPDCDRHELGEALSDAQQALHELTRGLDQLSWIGRWLNGTPAAGVVIEPLSATFERVAARVKYGALKVTAPPPELRVRGGEALERLLDILIANGHQHAPRAAVWMHAEVHAGRVAIEVEDTGRPLAPEFADRAFTLEGQTALKGRSEGRYGRVAGLFVANVLASALGADLTGFERDKKNVFRLVMSLPDSSK
jgi:signal transduction histidine kinase